MEKYTHAYSIRAYTHINQFFAKEGDYVEKYVCEINAFHFFIIRQEIYASTLSVLVCMCMKMCVCVYIYIYIYIYIYVYIYIYIYIYKVGDCCQGRPKDSFFNSYYTEV